MGGGRVMGQRGMGLAAGQGYRRGSGAGRASGSLDRRMGSVLTDVSPKFTTFIILLCRGPKAKKHGGNMVGPRGQREGRDRDGPWAAWTPAAGRDVGGTDGRTSYQGGQVRVANDAV